MFLSNLHNLSSFSSHFQFSNFINLIEFLVEAYPAEALRADLSVQLGLTDRQLQMWFCHRRLKDRKTPPVKRPKKEISSSGGGGGDDVMVSGEGLPNEHGGSGGSGSGSSPFGHTGRPVPAMVATASGRVPAVVAAPIDMPPVKRYYEPPHAVSEVRAIAFVEAQLGERLREDGPILGMEFDPLPPGAFGAPIGNMISMLIMLQLMYCIL